jgi:hypothetical protein
VSGTIGIVAQETSRYTMFWISVLGVLSNAPPKTRWDIAMSSNVPVARNTLVERSLKEESDWILFVDDDQVFPADLLKNLLAHDVDVVCAPYLRRAGQHTPIAYSHRRDDGLYEPIDLTKLPGEGLLKVQACGAGGLLVRSHVFHAISSEPDWFQYGHVGAWDASEDIVFAEKCNAAGFDVYVDLGSPIGHMGPAAVWPSFIDKEWCLGFSVSDGTRLFTPIEDNAVAGAPADAVRR